MKSTTVLLLGMSLVSVLCVGIAGWMAIHSLSDWGWFLVAGVVIVGGVAVKEQ